MDFPIKNGDFPIKNGDFPIKNSDFPIKNGDFPINNGDFPIKNGKFRFNEARSRTSLACGPLKSQAIEDRSCGHPRRHRIFFGDGCVSTWEIPIK